MNCGEKILLNIKNNKSDAKLITEIIKTRMATSNFLFMLLDKIETIFKYDCGLHKTLNGKAKVYYHN